MWTYRILFLLNAVVLIASLWVALSMWFAGFATYLEAKAALIAWPFFQLPGLLLAIRTKRRGEVRKAALILAAQLVVLGGISVAWMFLVALS